MKQNRQICNANAGREELHIGGALILEDGAKVEGILTEKAENVADSTATTVAEMKEDFNELLSALKTAGLMEADAE